MFFCSGLIVPLDAWKGFMGDGNPRPCKVSVSSLVLKAFSCEGGSRERREGDVSQSKSVAEISVHF